MFKGSANYPKLKTNLRLAINRLKLLEKKKTELTQKARREIADFISAGKDDRARIRVEHIVREDYLVEAMELLEMYCDLLLARFGLIQTQKELDPGLEEAIASLLWATPRLSADINEMKAIFDQFSLKYGKEFAQACMKNSLMNVNEKIIHKLGVQAPPKILVERYMIEIAKNFNVPFEPDPTVMQSDEIYAAENLLIDCEDLKNPNDSGVRPGGPGGSGYGGGGGGGGQALPPTPVQYNQPPPPQVVYHPPMPQPQKQPPALPSVPPAASAPYNGYAPGPPYPTQPTGPPPTNPSNTSIGLNPGPSQPQVPSYNEAMNLPPAGPGPANTNELNFPDLPNVPSTTLSTVEAPGAASAGGEDVDFDDLTRRFEELKRRK